MTDLANHAVERPGRITLRQAAGLLAIVAVVVALDQVTKWAVRANIERGDSTWDRLAEVCTDDPVTLTTVVNRVYRARHEPNRYQAMRYLTARQGDRRGPCAAYGGNAGSPAT